MSATTPFRRFTDSPEQNRRRMRDPVARAKHAAVAKRVNGSPAGRKRISERMKASWADAEKRARLVAGIQKSKRTPEARAKFSALLKARWQDPSWREKWTAANRARCAALAEQARGRKQSREHVENRVASRLANAARKAGKT